MDVMKTPFKPVWREAKSTLEIVNISNEKRQVIQKFDKLIEAPEWTKDGERLIYNSFGHIFELNLSTLNCQQIDTGFARNCNNDHVLSPCQSRLAFSHNTVEDGRSRIYLTSLSGGQPKLVTPMAPSYLHSWSPDGKLLAYCAKRNGQYDIHTIPAEGGEEVKLTHNFGHNDGPEFSPCGKFIYFNSTQSGLMQIWRMKSDGSELTQITTSSANHWFPHISPNGKYLSCIVYAEGDVLPHEHPPNKHVLLRVLNLEENTLLLEFALFGGQGTMNVNSWAPDSNSLAFVSYTPV